MVVERHLGESKTQKRHAKESCGDGLNAWICELCNEDFSRMESLGRHQGLNGREEPACTVLKKLRNQNPQTTVVHAMDFQ